MGGAGQDYSGSGDCFALGISDGFIELCAEEERFIRGTIVPYYPWRY